MNVSENHISNQYDEEDGDGEDEHNDVDFYGNEE
jgi:hypothetical protein